MNLKEIQELIEFISRRDFARFEMENEGFKLKLVRAAENPSTPLVHVSPVGPAPGGLGPVQVPSPMGGSHGKAAEVQAAANGLHQIKSPIVGTFYRAPNPQAEPFVETGSTISVGQPLCIVEAMKLMNEIESDMEGEVVEILVANGQPVEYGEVLFRIRPTPA
ncbi:MAG: acetyl-CoA carboxylase biotin carboxyl carrier protein [Acidobacteriota bacterium]